MEFTTEYLIEITTGVSIDRKETAKDWMLDILICRSGEEKEKQVKTNK